MNSPVVIRRTLRCIRICKGHSLKKEAIHSYGQNICFCSKLTVRPTQSYYCGMASQWHFEPFRIKFENNLLYPGRVSTLYNSKQPQMHCILINQSMHLSIQEEAQVKNMCIECSPFTSFCLKFREMQPMVGDIWLNLCG